jgi:hypothetical protein
MGSERQKRAAHALCLFLPALAGCNEDALRPPPAASAQPLASAAAPAGSSSASHAISNAAWTAIARSPDPFELHPLKGALLVDAAGFLAVLGDGPLRQSPAVMKGLEKGASGHLLGAYPDAAWLVANDGAYRWTGDRWKSEDLARERETVLAITAWDNKSAIAAIGAPGNDMRFALASGKPGAAVPVPAPADPRVNAADHAEPPTADEGEPCKVRMKPREVVLAGLPSGELVAAGYTCEPVGHGGAIVERWGSQQTQGTVEALPHGEGGASPRVVGIVARSATEIVVYGGVGVPPAPYLARFDGAAWTLDSAPFGAAVETLAASDDGTWWAASAGTVWRKPARAAWEQVPLPAGLVTHAAWPRPGTNPPEVWVAAREREGKARAVLLRTVKGDAPDLVRLPPRNAMAGAIATSGHFFATAACDKAFAQLGLVAPRLDAQGKVIPPPKEFPALKPLLEGDLAGYEPVVEDAGGSYRIGVLFPRRDLARKLVAAYQDAFPQAPAAGVFCHDPVAMGEAAKPPEGAKPPRRVARPR